MFSQKGPTIWRLISAHGIEPSGISHLLSAGDDADAAAGKIILITNNK